MNKKVFFGICVCLFLGAADVFAQQLQVPVWIPIKGTWTVPADRTFRGANPDEGKEFEGYLNVAKNMSVFVWYITAEAAQAYKEKLAAYDAEMAEYNEAKAAYDTAKAEAKAAKAKFTEKAPAKPAAVPASAKPKFQWRSLEGGAHNGAQEAAVKGKPPVYFLWGENDGKEVQWPVTYDEYNKDGSFARTLTSYIFCRSGNVKLYRNEDGSFASVTSTAVAYQKLPNGQFRTELSKAEAFAAGAVAGIGKPKGSALPYYDGPMSSCCEAAVTGPAVYKKPVDLPMVL